MTIATYTKKAIKSYLKTDKGKEALHRYYEKNKDKVKERSRLYRLENREIIKQKRMIRDNNKKINEFFDLFKNFF